MSVSWYDAIPPDTHITSHISQEQKQKTLNTELEGQEGCLLGQSSSIDGLAHNSLIIRTHYTGTRSGSRSV